MSNDYQEFDEADFAVMMPNTSKDEFKSNTGAWLRVMVLSSPRKEFNSRFTYRRLRSLLTPEQIEHFKRKEVQATKPAEISDDEAFEKWRLNANIYVGGRHEIASSA